MANLYDVLIIGAGPAGMTAAVYASRANLKVGMIEKGAPGGQMINTAEIENYTGFETITGPDLAMKMFEHTQKTGAEYLYGQVSSIEDNGNYKTVNTDEGNQYQTKAVIIATGTKNRPVGAPGEMELAGRGISWCAICDGAFYKDREVAVIGGGNSAVEEGIYLASICSKVSVIHRRDALRADKTLQDRAFKLDNVEFVWDSYIESFNDDNGKLGSITVKNKHTNELKEVKAEGAFIYVGLDPVTDFLKDLDVLDERNYILVNKEMETKVPGIFGAGDVVNKDLRQVVTAAGDGAVAAQNAIKYIEGLE